MRGYKISIPFPAFLTANSILVAADFVLLQLWLNFQEPKCNVQWEAVGIAAIFVYYFVILSVISMILSVLNKVKTKNEYEVSGLPVTLFFFSLGFTIVFVFQAIVTHVIKVTNQDLSMIDTLYNHDCLIYFWISIIIPIITAWAIVRQECWNKIIWSFKNRPGLLVLAILGILIAVTGVEIIFAKEYIPCSCIISGVLIFIGLLIICCCLQKCRIWSLIFLDFRKIINKYWYCFKSSCICLLIEKCRNCIKNCLDKRKKSKKSRE